MIIRQEVVKIAESYLNAIIMNNSYLDLGLPKKINELSKCDWNISFSTKSECYSIPVYVAEINFFCVESTIATYKLYLSDNLEFVDEFFITH